MRNFTLLVILFIFTSGSIAQTQVEVSEKEQEKIDEKASKTVEENEKDAITELAIKRATELQKELNLTNYTSKVVQKSIIDYSIKANRIIQSDLPIKEKTKTLSNLIYFQNEELKDVLTVEQFYKYLKLKDSNLN
ncbi:hypothetical protein GCM10022393_12890 [Aquimarina addita]|uniref:DUF4168 domain-containing protein n=1 Tax=Aquimarina addita TaxID=870485 RepID=A0ABP7XFZ9_9FLAO